MSFDDLDSTRIALAELSIAGLTPEQQRQEEERLAQERADAIRNFRRMAESGNWGADKTRDLAEYIGLIEWDMPTFGCGHTRTVENTLVNPRQGTRCRACANETKRRNDAAGRAARTYPRNKAGRE